MEAAAHQGWNAKDVGRAQRAPVVKAILMAGAAKGTAWHKGLDDGGLDDVAVPLDYHLGAGELDLFTSYGILAAGFAKEGAVAPEGWSYQKVAPGSERIYRFQAARSGLDLTASLAWNRHTTQYRIDLDTVRLSDLDLSLYRLDAAGPVLVAESRSAVDNVELLYVQDLPAGTYELHVEGIAGLEERYGLAWSLRPPPLPPAPAVSATAGGCGSGEIQVQWPPVDSPGVAGYRLYVRPEGGRVQVLRTGATTGHTLTGLPLGTRHTLWVQAYTTAGDPGAASSPVVVTTPPDSDGDGFADGCDNCTGLANPDQYDADGDGYGNVCDCDFNQDGFCGAPDFGLFLGCFNQYAVGAGVCAATDMNGDGFVGAPDFGLFLGGFNGPPGPSGVAP
ncbi:MAG: fibronectin type III domain-containing protein [Nitrospirae bacterium]|nr:MAG: fibronectin type III domain-containing protein [Nitrospirota bacterium]